MKKTAIAASAVLLSTAALSVLGATADPAVRADSYTHVSAVADGVTGSDDGAQVPREGKGIVGVARALAIGFTAAKAPTAVGNVARLASIFGFTSTPDDSSEATQSAYFDR